MLSWKRKASYCTTTTDATVTTVNVNGGCWVASAYFRNPRHFQTMVQVASSTSNLRGWNILTMLALLAAKHFSMENLNPWFGKSGRGIPMNRCSGKSKHKAKN